jgi:hypothetical protein
MATNAIPLRLPPDLKTEAQAHAARLGISLNALVAVALRDYLDGRTPRHTPSSVESSAPLGGYTDLAPAVPPPPRSRVTTQRLLASMGAPYRAPPRRSDPCPCGARNESGYPVKWKHCHGKPDGQ